MTRNEAIQRLNLLKGTFCVDTETALDMAISALSEAENGCDGCLYEVSDGSLFPCNICRLNYGCKYEKDDSKNITESPNEVVKKNDEVIEPSDLISRADAVNAMRKLLGKLGEKAEIELNCLTGYVPSVSSKMKEYVKDGTLTIQARTIKEVNSIDKVVVYADGYEQEYLMPIPSAEPTTRERKEAKSTLLTLKHLFEDEDILKSLDVAIECVSAEPKHGEWIKNEPLPSQWQYKCNQCGCPSKSNSHNFCPNCGAYMGKGESDD